MNDKKKSNRPALFVKELNEPKEKRIKLKTGLKAGERAVTTLAIGEEDP